MVQRVSVDAICRLINALLPAGYPIIDDVARVLQTSPRTLQRRLKEAGVSYSDLVEHCRREKSCEALMFNRDSIQDIAVSLGYRDVSSFTRAFRRWTGATPSTWRKQRPGLETKRIKKGANLF